MWGVRTEVGGGRGLKLGLRKVKAAVLAQESEVIGATDIDDSL